MVNDFGMDTFIRALDRKLREKIRDRAPKDLDDALRMALEYEVHERSPSAERREPTKKAEKATSNKEKSNVRMVTTGNGMTDPVLAEMRMVLDELKEECRTLNRDFQAMRRENLKSPRSNYNTSSGLNPMRRNSWRGNRQSNFRRPQAMQPGWKKSNRRSPYEWRKPGLTVRCWNCNQEGHVQARCPLPPQQPGNMRPAGETKSEGPTRSFVKSADAEIFVQVQIGQKHRRALLDTGCSRTLLPLKMLPKSTEIRPILAE
jgi:hypothetical protein